MNLLALRTVLFISVTLILSSCSVPQDNLSAKESRMSEELLRSQVLRYKAKAEKDIALMAEFCAEYAPLDSPYTPEMRAAMSTALAALAEDENTRGYVFDFTTNPSLARTRLH